ncbi:MAG: hypothetical protein KatS3mg033_1414 [Thermonema sp.]|uniref:hypothetical protein n=1 Tax=Thermonema TaxID=28194 RepID=UPI00056EEB5C|nr:MULTISPECIES: hypothetical protein [Thermonema]GIV39614.1 MAG: hypothetical protein KatS3mg033_1414 [Thermonema sp.]
MKLLFFSLTIYFFLANAPGAIAQMSREEAKHWYNIYKKTSPLEFKALVEGNDSLRRIKANKQKEVQALRTAIIEKEQLLMRLRNENRLLEEEVREINASRPLPSVRQGVYMRIRFQGVVKGVEIPDRILKNTDMHAYQYDNETFYVVGYFKDYWLAENFRKHLLQLGIPNPEIIAFCNGIPMDMKDALAIILGGEVEDCSKR